MSPIFPTFKQPYLQSFLVCSCFKLSNSSLSKHIRKLDGKDERETRFESSSGFAWIRVIIGARREESSRGPKFGRFQIDCALESGFPPSRAQEPPPNTTEEVQECLRLIFKQEKLDSTCCRGRFFVPKSELPVGGFVRLLLDVSTGVGKAKMNLIGAAFDIQGHRPFGEVKWKVRARKKKGEADEDELDLTISAFPDPVRFSGQLEKVAQMLSKGMQELVIGTGE